MEEEKGNYKIIKLQPISKDSKVNIIEDIFILERILENFIPFFYEINYFPKDKSQILKSITEIIIFLGNFNSKSKKKKGFFSISNLKSEEKEFLYKTYFSSSHSEINPATQNSFRFLNDDTIQVFSLSDQVIRSLLIILKEELNITQTSKQNTILLNKLGKIKKIVLNESKPFDYIILSVFLLFIVRNFCSNVEELIFEGNFYGKVEQIEVMLKNGVLLLFVLRTEKFEKFTFNNKIEFINENIAFKILSDYCNRENITEFIPERIIFNKINIFNVLVVKTNLKLLKLKKVNIDKNSIFSCILDIIENNPYLKELSIDKFVSIPENLRERFIALLKKRTLKKLKLSIMSSTKDDLNFLVLAKYISCLERFSLKLGRCCNENNQEFYQLTNTNLKRLSLSFEKLILDKQCLSSIFTSKLRTIKLSHIDYASFELLTDYALNNNLKVKKFHIIFIPFNDDNYELAYDNIMKIIEECRFIKEFIFENFNVKYKNVFDVKIKQILTENINIRKLLICSHMPFHVEKLEGFYYSDYPKYKLWPILYTLRKNKKLRSIYTKHSILCCIFSFFRIRKEKEIQIAYKV